ncbi:MAG: hypothetical protein ACOYNC_10705 [Bacteroidales bacterium]
MKPILRLLFLQIIFLFAATTYGQKLNGRVISYHDTYFSIHEVFGKIKKGRHLNDTLFHDQQAVFDRNGNTVMLTEYSPDSAVNNKFYGEITGENNQMESVYVRFDQEITTDKKPFILNAVKSASGETCSMTYKNDTNGRYIEETIYDLMGHMILTINVKRDDLGKPISCQYSDGSSDHYQYDIRGNRSEWRSRSPKGQIVTTTYKYDDHGNIIEENINDSFKASYKYHLEHNTFSYRYDEMGNWIERTDFEHDIPQRIVIRTIVYSNID